jgi:hypothetical protein
MKKINRILKCNTTGREITVKPDKYEKLLNYYGTDEAVERKFISYTVEKESRSPSIAFWFSHSIEMVNFKNDLEIILEKFKTSSRVHSDVLTLQNDTTILCTQSNINMANIEFIQSSDSRGGYVIGIKIKNIPFIKEYIITYEK